MTKTNPQVTEAKSRYNGDDLRSMFSAAARLLERNMESINALNVFPVPDGDTGTNMFLTMRSVMEGVDSLSGAGSSDVAAAMARGALMGARGNSGVILSQFFKGMSIGLQGTSDFGAEELVGAYQQARTYSYKAVGEPVEGTMLTVIGSVAEAANRALDANGTVQDVSDAVCKAARETVALTPTMLPVLREAGVVDAGGHGFAVILEGIRRTVNGENDSALEVSAPAPVGVEGIGAGVSAEFLSASDQELYGYCTQFMVRGESLDLDGIKGRMADLAHSTVVVGDETLVKVHVHAEDPGLVISVGAALGTLDQVSIQNMDEQHVEYSAAHREEAGARSDSAKLAVVAVALGDGLSALFASLGASEVVGGGDTMNPSVQDLLDAIDRVPGGEVVLLPNNGNIVPAAEQAAEASSKSVKVVPSKTIPQGIAATLSFNPEGDLESVSEEMVTALDSVQTAEVTRAVRSVTLNGVAVEAGSLIGLLDRKLVAAGDGVPEVLIAALKKAQVSKGSLVTLYRGDPLTAGEAEAASEAVTSSFEGVEIELVEGGQPHYHLLASIE